MSYGVDLRRDSDPELLWLWRRPAATSLIRPLAWEPPHAAGSALEKAKSQKAKKKKKKRSEALVGGTTWMKLSVKETRYKRPCIVMMPLI